MFFYDVMMTTSGNGGNSAFDRKKRYGLISPHHVFGLLPRDVGGRANYVLLRQVLVCDSDSIVLWETSIVSIANHK